MPKRINRRDFSRLYREAAARLLEVKNDFCCTAILLCKGHEYSDDMALMLEEFGKVFRPRRAREGDVWFGETNLGRERRVIALLLMSEIILNQPTP